MFQLFAVFVIFIDKIPGNRAADSRITTEGNGQCTDFSGRIYQSGMHYMPGPDTCNLCICHNGEPKGCKLVLCSAPTECKSFQLGNNCCEYVCLDDTFAERTTDFVASGITATLSLSLLFFLVNRLRQRKIRGREARHQNSSDERSIVGSIGYITGNMGYMEGNIPGMDYPYGNAQHYPLWKPPNSYFPRGEAPPPYEEAVALSQAEALSAAQCTVSVATTHRSLPITLNQQQQSENDMHQHLLNQQQQQIQQQQQQQQQQAQQQQQLHQQQHNITTSTTNLINININSGGNLTTVATGENHQPPYSCITSIQQQPRGTQTQQSNYSSLSSSSSIGEPSTNIQQSLPQQQFRQAAICVQTQPISQQQNLVQQPTVAILPQLQAPQYHQSHNFQPQIMHQHQSQQQQQHIQTIECSYKNCTLNATNSTNTTSATTSSSKILSSSKSHRITTPDTISQYNASLSAATAAAAAATAASSATTSNSIDSKLQNKYTQLIPPPFYDGEKTSRRYHRTIPCNFAKAVDSALSESSSNILGNSNPKSDQDQQPTTPTSKKPTCQCPVQHVPMSYMGVNQFNSVQQNNGNAFLTTLTTKLTSPNAKYQIKPNESLSNNSTLKRNSSHSPSTSLQNKISTISKQVGEMQQLQQQNSKNLKSQKIQSNLENDSQFLQTIPAENNPVLPPKMHKHFGNVKQKQTQKSNDKTFLKSQVPPSNANKSQTKIHTISKDLIVQQQQHPTPHRVRPGVLQTGYSTKSLPRQYKDEKAAPVFTLPPSSPHGFPEKQQLNCNIHNVNGGKSSIINSSTFYPTMIQSVAYTLPKNHSKNSLNNQIANVVSKVPSVINLPAPQQQFSKAVATMSSQLESASMSMINSKHNLNAAHDMQHLHNNKTNPNECKQRSTLPKISRQQMLLQNTQNPTMYHDDSNKSLPVCTTSKNCSNPNQHFLPNDTSLDDDYLSECENCKIANSSKYYLTIDETTDAMKQETQTLQRNKVNDEDDRKCETGYYRTSSTLPTNTKKTTNIKNTRETWFPSIQGNSSSDEENNE